MRSRFQGKDSLPVGTSLKSLKKNKKNNKVILSPYHYIPTRPRICEAYEFVESSPASVTLFPSDRLEHQQPGGHLRFAYLTTIMQCICATMALLGASKIASKKERKKKGNKAVMRPAHGPRLDITCPYKYRIVLSINV